MDRLKQMKDKLIDAVEEQISQCLSQTSTEELGEVIDMIKDLDEAIYYCTATKAMETRPQDFNDYFMPYEQKKQLAYPSYDGMYYSEGAGRGGRGGYSGNTSSYYHGGDAYGRPMTSQYALTDGRSDMRRKMYIEGKHMHQDKNKQIQELEAYVRELGQDLTDMIEDASPEEKQILQQKLSALANKIK